MRLVGCVYVLSHRILDEWCENRTIHIIWISFVGGLGGVCFGWGGGGGSIFIFFKFDHGEFPLGKLIAELPTYALSKRPVRPCWRSHYDQSALFDFEVFRLNAVRSLKNDCGRSENFLGRTKVSNYLFSDHNTLSKTSWSKNCFTKAPRHRCIKWNPRYQVAYTTSLTRSHCVQRSVSWDFICSMLFEHHGHIYVFA